jgi:hypothetical protein
VKNYDPKLIHCVFAGHFLDGFADGTFVSFSKAAPPFSKKVGVGGDVARTRNHNRSGTVTFTLMQTSESNQRLSQILAQDLAAPNGAGVGSLSVQDIAGTTLFTAAKAWIESDPDASFELESSTRAWVIAYEKLEATHGSNPDA